MELAKIEQGTLVLVPETLERISAFPANTKWIVVFGVGRGGKSTLCNLLTKTKSFTVSNKSEPCTYGIWISEPVADDKKSGEYFVVVDSEGTDMLDTKYQHKILALACLLACNGGVLIHNERHYSNSAISTLATVASSMKLLRGLEKEQFPYLCFLVRDFEREVEVKGVEATLDEFFRYILTDTGDKYDADRQLIRQSFDRKKMFTTPPLEKKIRTHIETHNELPECEFKTSLETIDEWLREVLDVKRVGGCVCEGTMLQRYIEECVKSVNEGDYVAIPSVLETTMDAVCGKRSEEALNIYLEGMAQIKESLAELEEAKLTEVHEGSRQSAIQVYSDSTNGYYKISAEKFLVALNQKISHEYADIQVTFSRLQTERILNEERKRQEEAERQVQLERTAREEVERQLAATPPGCQHEFTAQNISHLDTSHNGKWGGFLYGHKCCGRCRGNVLGRCESECKGICGKPRQTFKVEHFCKKCGAKPAA